MTYPQNRRKQIIWVRVLEPAALRLADCCPICTVEELQVAVSKEHIQHKKTQVASVKKQQYLRYYHYVVPKASGSLIRRAITCRTYRCLQFQSQKKTPKKTEKFVRTPTRRKMIIIPVKEKLKLARQTSLHRHKGNSISSTYFPSRIKTLRTDLQLKIRSLS